MSNLEPKTPASIGEAAAEFTRLHRALGQQAVPLTRELYDQLLKGEEGITWSSFRGIPDQRVPILPPVIKVGDKLELGAGYNRGNDRRSRILLGAAAIYLPAPDGGPNLVEKRGLAVIEPKVGFAPGGKTLVADGSVWRADLEVNQPSGRMHLASGHHTRISNTFVPLREVDEQLRQLLSTVQAYEQPQ